MSELVLGALITRFLQHTPALHGQVFHPLLRPHTASYACCFKTCTFTFPWGASIHMHAVGIAVLVGKICFELAAIAAFGLNVLPCILLYTDLGNA